MGPQTAFIRSPTHPAAAQVRRAGSTCPASSSGREPQRSPPSHLDRRELLLGAAAGAAVLAGLPQPSWGIQGLTAGRIPGVTGPDSAGLYTYTRPEGKSGGHGVGWSEIPRYSFKVPGGWDETPVSIADLGGTEIDLRYSNPEEGTLMVIVAPVLRFADVGFNANVTIDELAPPERIIEGFAPELFGAPLNEGDVVDTQVETRGGVTYYSWEVKPHRLVAAAAVRNRLFIMAISANGRQWRRAADDLRRIQQTFTVPPA